MRVGLISTILLAVTLALPAQRLELVQTIESPFALAEIRLVDLDGRTGKEMLIVGRDGEVRTWRFDPEKGQVDRRPRGALNLPDPAHTLFTLGDLSGTGAPAQLVTASPAGIRAWRPTAAGTFDRKGTQLTRKGRRGRARFILRVGQPTWSDLVRHVNGDAYPDVVLPLGDSCELWMNPGPKSGATASDTFPTLTRTARLSVRIRRHTRHRGTRLSDVYESTFVIPRLNTRDVNGDALGDVLVEDGRNRAWHLQRSDGTIPPDPDISLDLRIFRDTTQEAGVRPGRILAGGNRQSMQSRDLNGDGVPDYVIAHRRKLWVFHGTAKGPRFSKPAQILKAADDVTTLLLVNLDDDQRADLVVIKVLIPTVGTLLLSALGNLEVEVAAVGYAAVAGGTFEIKPRWRSELTVALPSITSMLKNPYAIVRRFEEASAHLGASVEGDLDGDGKLDVLEADAATKRVSVWNGATVAAGPGNLQGDGLLRYILFEDTNRVWDLDRIVDWISRVSQSELTRRTGGREPDVSVALRNDPELAYRTFRVGDIDGSGKDTLIVLYERPETGRYVLDLFRWK